MKFLLFGGIGIAALLLLLRAGYHWVASIYKEADDILES
jgi:hypothetical protein